MTLDTQPAQFIDQGDMLAGPFRVPRNLAANEKGSIHDDATAKPLGFRGGTVAGSIHMEQFPPLLVRAFGERWFERGGLSAYFRNATTGGEPVRAFAGKPAAGATDAQIDVRMDDAKGMLVLEGTASVGAPSEPSMLRRKLAEPRTTGELRILAHLQPGQESPEPARTRMEPAIEAARLRAITEPMPCYEDASIWGGRVANPGLVVHLMTKVQPSLQLARNRAVGLYGAIEINHINGPVFCDRDYEVSGKILALGDSPKSEIVWFESTLREPGSGRDIASMIMMLRFMKASSKLWQS